MTRYAARRDSNEQSLVKIARELGAKLWPLHTPCDWLMAFRGAFYAVEIKTPDGDYTQAQRDFMIEAADAGCAPLVWRTVQDVVNTISALTKKSHTLATAAIEN